jgi:hypothetical protein
MVPSSLRSSLSVIDFDFVLQNKHVGGHCKTKKMAVAEALFFVLNADLPADRREMPFS